MTTPRAFTDIDLAAERGAADLDGAWGWFAVRCGHRVIGLVWVEHGEDPHDIARTCYGPVADSAPATDSTHTDHDVTFVVCTSGRTLPLETSLAALGSLDPPAKEIIVVHRGALSDDEPITLSTEAATGGPLPHHLQAPSAGLNQARNTGWRAATSPLVVFLDDGAIADPHLVRSISGAFFDEAVGVVAGPVLTSKLDTPTRLAFERMGGMRGGDQPYLVSPGYAELRMFVGRSWSNVAFRRSCLEATGGFDEHFDVGIADGAGGDADLIWRVVQSGSDLHFCPDAIVRNAHPASGAGLAAEFRRLGLGYTAFLERRSSISTSPYPPGPSSGVGTFNATSETWRARCATETGSRRACWSPKPAEAEPEQLGLSRRRGRPTR